MSELSELWITLLIRDLKLDGNALRYLVRFD